MAELLRETVFPPAIALQLLEGDITTAPVEAIVNPANEDLQHGGGLAGVISRKAGPSLQRESNAWIAEHGPISHNQPAFTEAGQLPFQKIIHAVGPVWGTGHEQTRLTQAVQGSLRLARELDLASLALPAISAGVFRYPVEQAARVILKALQEDCQASNPEGIKLIQIYVFNFPAREAFCQAWDELIR
jgi:O-acetyl-ADP-ribose deacetylase (regulator of RNase III)